MLQVRRNEAVGDEAIDPRLPPPVNHAATWTSAGTSAPELQFRELMEIFRRRGRFVVAIALVGTILAAVIGLLTTPRYTATAQLIVERPATGRDRVGGSGSGESIDTHVILVTSPRSSPARHRKAPAIRGLAGCSASASQIAIHRRDWHAIGRFGPARRPKGRSKQARGPSGYLDGALSFAEMGQVRPSRSSCDTKAIQEGRSRVITVAYTSANAAKTAEFVNLIVQLYVENLVEQRLKSASSEITRLQERIAEAKSTMERAGIAVQNAIQKRLEAEQNVVSSGPEADQQLREIEHQAATSAQLYGSLLRRQKEIRDQQEGIGAGVAIHALATVPHRPSSQNPILFILPAFFILAIGASGLAVILEKLDRGLRSERATAEALGIPCIGLVPALQLDDS